MHVCTHHGPNVENISSLAADSTDRLYFAGWGFATHLRGLRRRHDPAQLPDRRRSDCRAKASPLREAAALFLFRGTLPDESPHTPVAERAARRACKSAWS